MTLSISLENEFFFLLSSYVGTQQQGKVSLPRKCGYTENSPQLPCMTDIDQAWLKLTHLLW